jgi:hypothetical protein
MPVLNRDLYKSLCDSNKSYLIGQGLVPANTNLDVVLPDNSNQIISQLIINEKLNKQKQSFKSEYVTQTMSIALMLLAGGFTLASFFIASAIVLPILPVLLLGFGVIAVIKFILSFKVNCLEVNTNEIVNSLSRLEVDANAEESARNIVGNEIRELREITITLGEQTGNLSEKIDVLSGNITQNLFKLGMFSSKPNPDLSADSANEFLNEEEMEARSSSPIHS